MQSSRVANLARRLSNSESLLKNNLNVNQNITKECHAAAAHKNSEHSDAKRSHRFRLSSIPFYSEVDRVSALSCCNIIAREMATSSTSAGSKEVTPPKFTNRLAKEQSPYLLQHAHNPVDWFPWGDEAFEKAKTENKLIFLSVGYSTCHWCHVMEVESFENEEIAKVMNEHFINIKVDREERPDIDKVYMTFVQATSGRGGWPMSVFLTPELNPVTGGTYYPPYDKYGRPGFKTILTNLATKWKDQREDFMTTGAHIIEVLKQVSDLKKVEGDPETQLPGDICWKTCIRKYVKDYDPEFGGFGMQPKFPQASNFDFLFHVYARAKDSDEGKQCLDMCLYTLKKMAYGGIHDHISKGFARYSVDEKWHVPHFEKMLYDQAQLAIAYSDAYLATKDEFYAKVTRDIFEYVHRDMTHPEGGFYSAEDADSYPVEGAKEKKEGAFCLWEYEDVEALLDGKKLLEGDTKLRTPFTYFEILKTHYNIERGGNISTDSDPHGEMLNKNVFIILGSPEATAEKYGITVEKLDEIVEECRCILYAERQKRPRPHLDSKILCSWNGLMIAAYAKAGQVLADKEYIGRAVKAAMFVKKNLYNKEQGSLYRSCYRGDDGSIAQMSVPINGFLDDYAFLIRGLLDLYEASLNREWLYWASSLQEKQDALFWDPEGDGYFTSPLGDANVVLKLKEDQDGAEPSGNSVSIQNLLRLSAHMGGHGAAEQPPSGARRDRAARALAAFAPRLKMAPSALPQMVSALMLYMDSPTQVFIAGKRDDPRTIELLNVVRARLLPGRIVAVAEPAGGTPGRQSPTTGFEPITFAQEELKLRLVAMETMFSRIRPLGDRPAAYVCRHYTCLLPITDAKRLADVLDKDD